MKVVDASVATAWVLAETGSLAAHRLLQSSDPLVSVSFLLLEVHHAVSRAVQRGHAEQSALSGLEDKLTNSFVKLVDLLELAPAAMRLATRTGHPVYDCLYVVLAQRDSIPLMTADLRQAEIARRERIAFELL